MTVGGEWKRYTVSGKLDNQGGFRGRFLKPEIALLPDVDGGKLYINAPMLHRGEKEAPWVKAEMEKPEAQPAEPLEKSLAGFWRFDRMENNEIKDLSPKAHPAKITGAYQLAETKDGKGMLFDGNTFVTVPYTPELNIPNGEVTVELSLKPEPAKSMPVLTHGMQWGGYALQIAYGKYNPMFSAWKGVLTQPALPETVHLVMSLCGNLFQRSSRKESASECRPQRRMRKTRIDYRRLGTGQGQEERIPDVSRIQGDH